MSTVVTQKCDGCGFELELAQTSMGWEPPKAGEAGGWVVFDHDGKQYHLCNECTAIVTSGGLRKSSPAQHNVNAYNNIDGCSTAEAIAKAARRVPPRNVLSME